LLSVKRFSLATDNGAITFNEKLRQVRCCTVFALARDDGSHYLPLWLHFQYNIEIFGTTLLYAWAKNGRK
jgi:hypothetical protein